MPSDDSPKAVRTLNSNPSWRAGCRETCKSGSERGVGESTMRNHCIGAPASTLRDCQPSREDRTLTARLVEAGKLLGISVLDHIIIGDGSSKYFSFADEGLLT